LIAPPPASGNKIVMAHDVFTTSAAPIGSTAFAARAAQREKADTEPLRSMGTTRCQVGLGAS